MNLPTPSHNKPASGKTSVTHAQYHCFRLPIQPPCTSIGNITRLHFFLSTALREVVGPEAGANFHSWAVWGSRKAGVTIRQEDKDQASRETTEQLAAIAVGELPARPW